MGQEIIIDVNLKGVFNCCKSAAAMMVESNYGKIVNISSASGQMGNIGQVNYAASKGGVISITKTLAKDANVDGIIFERLAFCDNHGVDSPMQAKELEAMGIPVMIIEKEYMLSDVGRLQTRVDAFVERIERRNGR